MCTEIVQTMNSRLDEAGIQLLLCRPPAVETGNAAGSRVSFDFEM